MSPNDQDDARPRSNGFFRFVGGWFKMVLVYYLATLAAAPSEWASLIGNAFWISFIFAIPAKFIGDTMRQFGNTVFFNADTAFMILYVSFFTIWGVFNQSTGLNFIFHAVFYLAVTMLFVPLIQNQKKP